MNPEREALLLARDCLDEYEFICWALESVGIEHPHLDDACEALQRRISLALYPATTVGGWLYRQGIHAAHDQRQLARLAWINKLLEESCP